MNNLYILGAYVEAPLVRETRLVADLTMPERCWLKYEEPAAVRNPGYVTHSRERNKKRRLVIPKNIAFLRRQAT